MKTGFVAVVAWFGSQGFVNVHRYQAINEKVASLAPELNTVGELEYRRKLVDVLAANEVAPEDVRVHTDEVDYQYVVSVHSKWTLGLGPWSIELPVKHRASIKRVDVQHRAFVTG